MVSPRYPHSAKPDRRKHKPAISFDEFKEFYDKYQEDLFNKQVDAVIDIICVCAIVIGPLLALVLGV